jgi:CheY-specific phosphatase CheX
MTVKDSELTQIVSTIWQSVLAMDCDPTDDLPGACAGTMLGCVQIAGVWQGAVVMGCPRGFAANAAAIMFGVRTADCTVTDMQDAVAELTNMIGGNVKGLLTDGEACHLSQPSVVVGSDYATRLPGTQSLNRVALSCGNYVIVVHVLKKASAANVA